MEQGTPQSAPQGDPLCGAKIELKWAVVLDIDV